MDEKIDEVRRAFDEELQKATTESEVEQVRVKFLSRNGAIAHLFEEMKSVPVAEKPVVGKLLNALKNGAQAAFDAKKNSIRQPLEKQALVLDLTLPGRAKPVGTKHPLTQTIDEIKRIFMSMGFSVATGPEIETDYEMFARFSPDGKWIAFTGQYDGNTEVYLMPAEGGVPKRLTYTATLGRDDVSDRMGPNNIVMTWKDEKTIVYRSRRIEHNDFLGQLYFADIDGGIP